MWYKLKRRDVDSTEVGQHVGTACRDPEHMSEAQGGDVVGTIIPESWLMNGRDWNLVGQ